jgi:hypothetical protein
MKLMYYIVRGMFLGESVQGGGLERAGGKRLFESTSAGHERKKKKRKHKHT